MKRELATPRLRLRPFAEKDLAALHALLRDPQVNTFLPWFPVETREGAEAFLRNWSGEGHYAVVLRDGPDALVGYVNQELDGARDLGYGFCRAVSGRGLASEAAAAVAREARESGLPFLTATHDVNNPASGGVMRRIGMTYRYSYVELWQPKNFLVTFRLYQMDFDPAAKTYAAYALRYGNAFREDL